MIDCFTSQDQLPGGHVNDDTSELAVRETKREGFISFLPFPNGQRFTPRRTDSSSLPNCFYKGTEQVCIGRESPGWKVTGTWETGLCQVAPTKSQWEPTQNQQQRQNKNAKAPGSGEAESTGNNSKEVSYTTSLSSPPSSSLAY